MRTQEETRQDEVRMEYLFELVAVQGESLAKNLRELADIGERFGFEPDSVASVRYFADSVDEIKVLANTKGGDK